MGIFSKPKVKAEQTQDTTASTEEAKETAAKKQRLLETQGGNKGAELQANQGRSIRRIFGG